MVDLTKHEAKILEVAKLVMREERVSPRVALRRARDIVKRRGGIYKLTAEEKPVSAKKIKFNELPESDQLTIRRLRLAAEIRRREGRSLPRAKVLTGGKVSPR